jgi:hypothetical protein
MPGMPTSPRPELTAVLVVHAWRHGSPPHVVARLSSTLDVTKPDWTTLTVAGADEITAAIRSWLDEVGEGGAGDAPVTGT